MSASAENSSGELPPDASAPSITSSASRRRPARCSETACASGGGAGVASLWVGPFIIVSLMDACSVHSRHVIGRDQRAQPTQGVVVMRNLHPAKPRILAALAKE